MSARPGTRVRSLSPGADGAHGAVGVSGGEPAAGPLSRRALIAQGHASIRAGSQSFAAAARLLDPDARAACVMLYAWCRHCDDVVDGQEAGHGRHAGRVDGSRAQRARLDRLERNTRRACAGIATDEPVFAGLTEVVRHHRLPRSWLLAHLAGMRMDVESTRYETFDDTLLYCYRVAGTVGLMMGRLLGEHDPHTLDRACDLGIAFQLSNIARDVIDDASIGRIYLPSRWLQSTGVPCDAAALPEHREALAPVVARLVAAAEAYYASALGGIGALPLRRAWSIATARDVYRAIGHRVRQRGPRAWDQRVSTTALDKVWFTLRGAGVALATRTQLRGGRPAGLWQRPPDEDQSQDAAGGERDSPLRLRARTVSRCR